MYVFDMDQVSHPSAFTWAVLSLVFVYKYFLYLPVINIHSFGVNNFQFLSIFIPHPDRKLILL